MNFYKRDPDKALAGMAELTLQERGAYNTIIDSLYARDGDLPDDDDIMRRIMGCHGNEWRAVKAKLIAKGKIWVEDGFWKAAKVDDTLEEAANFSEIQRKRAGKRWERARKRAGNAPETADKRAANSEKDVINQCSPDAIAGNANTSTSTSTAIDTVQERTPIGVPKKSGNSRGSRLSPDWSLPDDWRAWAISFGLPPPMVETEAAAFLDFWIAKPGQGGIKLDWLATWRNWCRRAMERKPQRMNGGGNGKSRADLRFERELAMAREMDRRDAADQDLDAGEGRGGVVPLPTARRA